MSRDAHVRADAAHDLLFISGQRLVDHERIGHVRAGHRHHVGVAGREHGFGFREIEEAPDDEYPRAIAGHRFRASCAGGEETFIHRAHRGDGHVQRVVAAAGNIEKIEQPRRGENLDLFLGLFRRDPRGTEELVERQAHTEREFIAQRAPHRLAHLEHDAAAVSDRAAVSVVAFIERGTQEFTEQLAVRGVYFDAVETGAFHVGRRAREVVDEFGNVRGVHRVRHFPGDRRGDPRRRPQWTPVVEILRTAALCAGREQLHELPAVVRMHGLREFFIPRYDRRIPRRTARVVVAAGRMRGLLFEHEQGGAAARTFGVVIDVPIRQRFVPAVELRMSGYHDAMTDRDGTDIEWPQDARVMAGVFHGEAVRCGESLSSLPDSPAAHYTGIRARADTATMPWKNRRRTQ